MRVPDLRLTLALLILIAPASALTVQETVETVETAAAKVDPTLHLALCTPDDGNDYWVDYCFEWRQTTETVTYIEDARGEDPWCVMYPAPCAPSPVDPVQTATTDATLTRLSSEVQVDGAEVCGDLHCPDPCPYLGKLCYALDIYWGPAALDAPVALADVNGDGRFDGAAIQHLGTWYYAGFCDELTLSLSCNQTMTMEADVKPVTQWVSLCAGPWNEEEYWVDHCSSYEAHPLTAYQTSARVVRSGEACIIYRAPCIDTYQGEIVRRDVSGEVWTYRDMGDVNEHEAVTDVCQLDCPTVSDVEAMCDLLVSSIDQPISCNLTLALELAISPPWWMPQSIDWTVAVNGGLMDVDGDGWAEGMAVAYIPAWVGTSSTQDLLAVMAAGSVYIPWEYVPFACVEVQPDWVQVRANTRCASVAIEAQDVGALI